MNYNFNIHGEDKVEVLELLDTVQKDLDSERKFHHTVDNLLEGYQVIGYDWRYIYVNETVVKQSKFSREELVGYTMTEKYPGIENTEMFKTLSMCMDARVAAIFENEFTYPDGSQGWFQLSIQPTEGGLVILSNDISDRKRSEREKLEHIHGLERIIFMTSHNVRQPIAHLRGLVNLLKSGKIISDDFSKILDYLDESVTALDGHTQEITGYVHGMEIKAKK